MKKKITLKLIAEVKKQLKNPWHDQKWHDFMKRKDVEAICGALSDRSLTKNWMIQEEAQKFYNMDLDQEERFEALEEFERKQLK